MPTARSGAGNATPSIFDQRHIGRVLRSPCGVRGRRLASSRRREPRPGRCPSLWPGDLRNDGGGVAGAGADGGEGRKDANLGGTPRSHERRSEEGRRSEERRGGEEGRTRG